MGHRKVSAPKRGSLSYLPKGRAASPTGRIRYWPSLKADAPSLLGFMGYKAGMTHVIMVEDQQGSPNFGKEVAKPATVIDTPPVTIIAVRAYQRTAYGLKTLTETWMKNPPKDINRLTTPPNNPDPENGLKKIEDNLAQINQIRLLAATQPRLAGVPKKKPELIEIKIDGATIKQQLDYVKPLLGKTISITDVFKEGQYLDVIAVSKGKGIQGVIKRWGVKIRDRKSRKMKRGVATLGPWNPHRVLYTVPRSGQMGYHQRVEYNKRILKIGTDGTEITPKGGFLRYGPVKGTYAVLNGSVPGPTKRLIRLRIPARPPSRVPEAPPKIMEISLQSPQG
ncbi:MAG TPA: 50S ribosomal protein L3 [Candidatus Bathyarchaeia archaeon]|nr:50S ribosomal protein L3 [Candidatus Bathyarchaeia archaeon]